MELHDHESLGAKFPLNLAIREHRFKDNAGVLSHQEVCLRCSQVFQVLVGHVGFHTCLFTILHGSVHKFSVLNSNRKRNHRWICPTNPRSFLPPDFTGANFSANNKLIANLLSTESILINCLGAQLGSGHVGHSLGFLQEEQVETGPLHRAPASVSPPPPSQLS